MGVGVNTTDPLAQSVHGTNPQNLLEKITRLKIYANLYWKEYCFGITAEHLVDRAMDLKYFGGTYGGNNKPSNFLCLVLKMLQLQPEKEIVIEFIKNEDFKYVRVLGAFYLRLVGKPVDIYKYLELLYNDFRKIRHRTHQGWEVVRVDEFIDELLTKDYACDIALPHLPKRWSLEELSMLPPRKSLAVEDLDEESDDDEAPEKEIPMNDKQPGAQTEVQDVQSSRHSRRRAAGDHDDTYERRGRRDTHRDTRRKRSPSPRRHRDGRSRRYMSSSSRSSSSSSDSSHSPVARRRKYHRSPTRRRRQRSYSRSYDRSYGRSKRRRSRSPRSRSKDRRSWSDSDDDRRRRSDKKKKKAGKEKSSKDENSVEFWNEQRAKLGLKPLK